MASDYNVPSQMTFSSMEKAGAPRAEVNRLKAWADRALNRDSGEASAIAKAKLHVQAAGEALRGGGEALLVGGTLGAIHAKLPGGLDMKIGTGANIHQIPIDGAIGAMGLIMGVFGAQMEVGKDLQNAGAAATAIFAFRKTNDLIVTAQRKASGVTPGGGAALPGQLVGHPVIAGENGGRRFGWAKGSSPARGADMGEDPVATAARNC